MPAGKYRIASLLDTASDPDDTTLLAAPGVGLTSYIQWLNVVVTTEQASSSINIEDGVGGSVLMGGASTAAGTTQYRFVYNDDDWGLPLTANTLINATIAGATGVVARVYGEVVVRGD